MFRRTIQQVFTLFLLLCSLFSYAQKYTISGYVLEEGSGEKLIGVNIIDINNNQGTTSNVYGFYSLTLPADTYQIMFSYVGFEPVLKKIVLNSDLVINQEMSGSVSLKEFKVEASKTEEVQDRTQMSTIDVPLRELDKLPVLLGEKDIMKTIQLLPGVQSGGEGNSGIYVRGGGPDQNLILLDGVPVYNASHLFGFFSIFTPEAINKVNLIKGGFPARYGGRLSSVLDIRMKDGDMQKVHGNLSVGLISSKLMVEGPIIKDKSSFIVSGRRTYIDLLSKPFQSSNQKFGYHFHDLTGKANYKFSDKDRVYLSAYYGQDKASTNINESDNKSEGGFDWGNIISAFRWNRIWNNKLFSNTTLSYTRYRFNIEQEEERTGTERSSFAQKYHSKIYDFAGKIEFDYLPSPNHYIRFGVGNTHHTFEPGVNSFKVSGTVPIDTTYGSAKVHANEMFAYVEDDMKLNERIRINPGVHFAAFNVSGKWYNSIQPRLGINYLLSEKASIKASVTNMSQYLHLLTNSTIGLPTDLWVPVTKKVKPQTSWQYALGTAVTLKKGIELSVEGYYKTMDGLVEYEEGASFFSGSSTWENKIEFGKGTSYGIETFLQKKSGKTTGWIGYTLSWSNRQFDNLNAGKEFPYRYDRRHDISVALTHEFNDKIDAGLVWVYGTGRSVTLPTSRYLGFSFPEQGVNLGSGGPVIEHAPDRNGFREPAYHRLDLAVNFKKQKKHGERVWTLGVYNAYSRANPFFLYTSTSSSEYKLKQVSLFPIIPSITYSYTW